MKRKGGIAQGLCDIFPRVPLEMCKEVKKQRWGSAWDKDVNLALETSRHAKHGFTPKLEEHAKT